MMGEAELQFNNPAWDWDVGLQRGGLLYRCGVGCCVVVGEATLCLTTRLLIWRVGFSGEACCTVSGLAGCCFGRLPSFLALVVCVCVCVCGWFGGLVG